MYWTLRESWIKICHGPGSLGFMLCCLMHRGCDMLIETSWLYLRHFLWNIGDCVMFKGHWLVLIVLSTYKIYHLSMYLVPEPLFCFLGLADGNHYCSFKLEYIKLSFELDAFVFLWEIVFSSGLIGVWISSLSFLEWT